MYKAPRGTRDLLPEEQPYWRYIEAQARALAESYGYQRLDTPIFEEAHLFVRTVGEGTDIVEKEMYSFQDRGGDLLTLRPEGTAPVCRAYMEHGMHTRPQPVRLYYLGPAFRYERPQAGRFRQHHQFGAEALGEADPALDAEVLEMAWRFLASFGLSQCLIKLNSIGCPRCRPAYLAKLKEYYTALVSGLCPDCKVRLERNPLRLLDCKQPSCQGAADAAPRSRDYLCPDCESHFGQLKGYLGLLALPFSLEHRLVRGLDYYTRTVFEIQPLGAEGAQSALLGGGRYDGLIEALGGQPTPGVGFAAGLERILFHLQGEKELPLPAQPSVLFVAYRGEEAKKEALKLAFELRGVGVGVVVASAGRSLKAQLRQANSLGAAQTLILGEEEVRTGTVVLRDMAKGEQRSLARKSVVSELKGLPSA